MVLKNGSEETRQEAAAGVPGDEVMAVEMGRSRQS